MKRWQTRLRGPVIILPYDGFGTPDRLALCGRVLEDEGFRPASDADRAWRNLVAMFKRFESDEVPGARVRARYGNTEIETVTDREGYFSLELRPEAPAAPGHWHEIGLEIVGAPDSATTGRVLVPSGNARSGIISDLDDTVIRSHVTRKLRMLLALAVSNSRTRKPFEGVAAFYRALREGASATEDNPIFYVSNGPWNLHVPLVEFLAYQKIPATRNAASAAYSKPIRTCRSS
jgi:phosphatidate phosphatase APP1